jgi:SAM-dependent methyltransferase
MGTDELTEVEQAHAEQIKRANAALAAAQDRSYWLERWQVDLNELMRKRGASEARAALRAARAVFRGARRVRAEARWIPLRVHDARRAVDEERRLARADEADPFARAISPDPPRHTPVTDLLYERLSPDAIEAVELQLSPGEQGLWDAASPAERRALALSLGVHHEVPAVLEATRLSSAMPPTEVHAMRRSSTAAGGSLLYADMVADACAETGFELAPGRAGLDFGCSSGRVVRVLAAAFPEMSWHGCDPLAAPIDWARANLPEIDFLQSPEGPPLRYGDGSFDLVFAISIWSHFAEPSALRWLDEMRRLLRPGGRLVLTTHGPHALAYASERRYRERDQLEQMAAQLYRDGFWFANEFGGGSDHGLVDPDWGTAYFTPEWLLARTSGSWRVGAYHPGRVEDHQDLYVLEPA